MQRQQLSAADDSAEAAPRAIPIVNYLVLADGDEPHLRATVCLHCEARFFGRRMACASCGGREFDQRLASRAGVVASFSIVYRAAEGVSAPFVSVIVALDDGATVKANLIGCPADPEHVRLGMRVQLTTFDAGVDDVGNTAVAFAFTSINGAPQ